MTNGEDEKGFIGVCSRCGDSIYMDYNDNKDDEFDGDMIIMYEHMCRHCIQFWNAIFSEISTRPKVSLSPRIDPFFR